MMILVPAQSPGPNRSLYDSNPGTNPGSFGPNFPPKPNATADRGVEAEAAGTEAAFFSATFP